VNSSVIAEYACIGVPHDDDYDDDDYDYDYLFGAVGNFFFWGVKGIWAAFGQRLCCLRT
jgi:hypothetical protein